MKKKNQWKNQSWPPGPLITLLYEWCEKNEKFFKRRGLEPVLCSTIHDHRIEIRSIHALSGFPTCKIVVSEAKAVLSEAKATEVLCYDKKSTILDITDPKFFSKLKAYLRKHGRHEYFFLSWGCLVASIVLSIVLISNAI